MKENLIILAGGASSRMKKAAVSESNLTEEEKKQAGERSKGLISIGKAGRPFLDYLLYNAKKAGYTDVYIVTQKDNTLFKSFYGHKTSGNRFHDLSLHYAIQYIPSGRIKPFGTADAVFQALEQYPDLQRSTFSVCNSDNLYSVAAYQLLRESHKAPNALISYDKDALKFSEERISKFALMLFNKEQFMTHMVEKPPLNSLESFKDTFGKLRVSMNIFKFDGALFYEYLRTCPINPERQEKELPSALMNMIIEHPKSVIGIPLSEHVPDLTSKDDIHIIKEYVKDTDLSYW